MKALVDRPGLLDTVLAVAATLFAVVSVVSRGRGVTGDEGVLSIVLVGLVGIGLVFGKRFDVAVLVAVVAARLIVTRALGNDDALVPAAMLALYRVARTRDRRASLMTSIGVAVVVALAVSVFSDDDFVQEFGGEAALMLLPIAVGDAMRTRADRVRDLVETESAARVQAERIRIAQDLHDVVAHGLSTIAIQSGVAAHLFEQQPQQAKESLEIINATGKHALEELRTMLGVLRSTDEDTPLRPIPADPDDLSDVLSGAANAGVSVNLDVNGRFPDDVNDACVVAVHRIVQEALTNVARHAGGAPTTVVVDHGDDDVHLRVVNQPGSSPKRDVSSTGVGIIGMRERAESLGGTLQAQPTMAGGYEVEAMIPYHRHMSENGR